MGIGFRPIRGNWRKVQLPVASAATFQQWAPVDWDGARNLIEATSASTFIVGVAASYSTASYPAGFITVEVPMDHSAVAVTNIPTNTAASAISFGQAYNITKATNNLRLDTTSQASPLFQIVSNGLLSSADSTVEVALLDNRRAFGSYSSASIF